jgi:hypothetical protein
MAEKDSKDRQGRIDKSEVVPAALVYQPTFELNENMCLGLGDKKIGQRVQLIVDYQVIEKTKSYCVLKVNSAYLRPSKRAF